MFKYTLTEEIDGLKTCHQVESPTENGMLQAIWCINKNEEDEGDNMEGVTMQ